MSTDLGACLAAAGHEGPVTGGAETLVHLQWLLDAGWSVRLQRHEPKGADWEPFVSVLAQSRTSAYSCAGSSPGEALAKVREEAGRVKLAAGLPFGGTVRDG